jgi:hypothetical protein
VLGGKGVFVGGGEGVGFTVGRDGLLIVVAIKQTRQRVKSTAMLRIKIRDLDSVLSDSADVSIVVS